MSTFAYQTPNKGNDIPADTFLVTGDGFAPNAVINWTVTLVGTTNANLTGSMDADSDGNLNTSFSSPDIEAYYADPTMPKIEGGSSYQDPPWASGASWTFGAGTDTETITLTGTVA